MGAISLATKGILCSGTGIRLIYVEKIDVSVDVDNPYIAVEVEDVKLNVNVDDIKIDIDVRDP